MDPIFSTISLQVAPKGVSLQVRIVLYKSTSIDVALWKLSRII